MATAKKLRSPRAAYAVLALLLLVSLTDWLRNSADQIDEIRSGAIYARHPFDFGDFAQARNLQPEAEAAGVRRGDVVIAVEGRPVDGSTGYYAAVRRARAGDRLSLSLRAGSRSDVRVKEVSIVLQPLTRPGAASPWLRLVVYPFIAIVMPLFCIALGYWVAAVRIHDRAAWLLLALMLCISTFTGTSARTMFGRDDMLQPLFTAYRVLFGNLVPTTLMLFAIAFPDRLEFDRKYPWAKWIVLGPLVLRVVAASLVVTAMMHHLSFAHRYWHLYAPLDRLGFLHLVALTGFFAIFGYRTATASDRDARRRLMLLVASGLVSFVPAAVLLLLVAVRGVRLEGLAVVPLLMMLIFPLTMAYVILVHRAMDVRVVIRQGLQYALTRGGVHAAQVVLSAMIVIGAASVSGDADASLLTRAALIGGGLAAVLLIGRFAGRLHRWVDRRFFRDAYEADEILAGLADDVRTMVETGPLLQTVATRIGETLHVPRIVILLDGDGVFRPAYALGTPSLPLVAIPREGLTSSRLSKGSPMIVRVDDPDSWVHAADAGERESIARLQPELLLPLSLNDKLLGIMSLGSKQSEEPYSRTDIRLLDAVATQTGLALENGRLTAAIAAEVAARAKETRDLEIAREVQERLFPQDSPPIAGVEYAGRCRPARFIGGDYYDFIPLPHGRFGIAIGDVSGKGIPAALLMATLRAYLRGGQTMHHQSDLREVMRTLNTLVYESSTANRYVTFFYGEFDPATRELVYVNAGHNQPMLLTRSPNGTGEDVVRLACGGTVVGLFEECSYEQGGVTLAPGDLLIAYTDGVSEAMNAAREEWGEEALLETVRADASAPAAALIERIMSAADAFASGAPQHDDMTVVAMRIF